MGISLLPIIFLSEEKTSERKCSFFTNEFYLDPTKIKTALKVSPEEVICFRNRSDLHDFKVKELSRKKKFQSGVATLLSFFTKLLAISGGAKNIPDFVFSDQNE